MIDPSVDNGRGYCHFWTHKRKPLGQISERRDREGGKKERE